MACVVVTIVDHRNRVYVLVTRMDHGVAASSRTSKPINIAIAML